MEELPGRNRKRRRERKRKDKAKERGERTETEMRGERDGKKVSREKAKNNKIRRKKHRQREGGEGNKYDNVRWQINNAKRMCRRKLQKKKIYDTTERGSGT